MSDVEDHNGLRNDTLTVETKFLKPTDASAPIVQSWGEG